MFEQSLTHTFKRYRTLQTDRITALPIVILMPHSACNCKCVMCDIWKDNKNLRQLTPADVVRQSQPDKLRSGGAENDADGLADEDRYW